MSLKEKAIQSRDEENKSSYTEALLPGDTYEEGPYLIFTEQYHLRRGSCCHSGCRHCPYGEAPSEK